MTIVKARINVAQDGAITGQAMGRVPPGDHEASIILSAASASNDESLQAHSVEARIHAIQDRLARLPMLDSRPADVVLGYDEHGLLGS